MKTKDLNRKNTRVEGMVKSEKILKKKCSKCGKIIISLHKKQLDYNFKQHINSHKQIGEDRK